MRIAGPSRLAPVVALTLLAAVAACRPAPEAPPVSPDAWAIVDGRTITREEVEKTYRRTASAPSESEEETLQAKLVLLDEMILRDILLARASALQIELPDTDLDAAYEELRKNVSDEQFKQELARRNLTADDMRDALRRDLLTQKVLEREVTSKVTVTDAEVAEFFEQNREAFNLSEDAWHLAQIVVTPAREAQVTNRRGDNAATPQEAARKVEMLLSRLEAGTSFRELASDYSEDPESAERGGDLGLVPASALQQAPAALRDAVINTPPGNVRVVTLGGVHTILLVVAREAAGQRDLTMPEVRERITEMLRGQREQVLRAAYLTALRSDAKVDNRLARQIVEADGRLPEAATAR